MDRTELEHATEVLTAAAEWLACTTCVLHISTGLPQWCPFIQDECRVVKLTREASATAT